MFRKTAIATVALLMMGSTAAFADECSGRDHTAGTVLGAIAGGVLGGSVSNGNGGAVVGGALLGGLAGNAIARDLDCNDRPYAERAYRDSFSAPVGRRHAWNHGQNRGYIVNSREYRVRGEICRDFTQVTYRRGREVTRQGTACRPARGEWYITARR
jgi:surface antigen